ncbi:MAG: ArsB/NhaD family transporter [Victivallaceae bacterium]|jgi:Na+/H+ antiporter NhaD/arsenite permease-like protein|nr:ArsB/NhaD family transporter [Victivallaceae bacterium]MDD3117082.1 ArsB/NhaD family transporter [Victivallaceae bacterium]MDD3702882.1 ArsB/NhaD family transporter [Victivallaceae bacterium]MDD5663219.1 ArsB/NhaD family transporter [Victivallaceae bacterium]
MNFTFWFGTIVFLGTYIVIASEKINKTAAAMFGASIMLLFILPGPAHHAPEKLDSEVGQHIEAVSAPQIPVSPEITGHQDLYSKLDTYSRYVNFDVIFTLAGMMILVNILSGTGLFQYVAIKSAKIAKGSPIRTLILLVISTSVLSAFLDNVTTILLVAPVTLVVAAELGVPVMPFLMAETMASNIGGTATLIGDPPNLIIGSEANLSFMNFIVNMSPTVIIVMVIYCAALSLYYSKRMKVTVEQRARVMEINEKAAITDPVNMKRGGIVMTLTIVGFLLHGMLGIQPSVVAMAGAALGLVVCKVNLDHMLEKVEWNTLFFFLGLFVIVRGAEEVGLMLEFGKVLNFMTGWNPLLIIMTIMWLSGIAAMLMNNVSYTAAMVSIVSAFIAATPVFAGNPEMTRLLWWALALSVCLGGNGALTGAAANMVTVGIASKAGVNISYGSFMRYGIPVAAGSMVIASLDIAFRYFFIIGK